MNNLLKKIKSWDIKALIKHPMTREITSFILHICTLMTVDIFFRILYKHNNNTTLGFWPSFWASFFWCVLIAGIAVVLPRLARRIYVIATTFIFAFLVIVHAAMDSFFGQYMSFSAVMFADDGAGYFEWSYITIPKKLIAVMLLCVVVSVFAALILPRTDKFRFRFIGLAGVMLLGSLGLGITVSSTFENDFGGITWDSTKSHADYYEEFSDYRYCMHLCGLYHYTFRDIYISTGLRDLTQRIWGGAVLAQLDEYYQTKPLDPDNEMTGVLKDKNLILIQLESIDSWMVNDIAMPTLSALMEESVSFTQFYAPKYLWAATFSTECAVNTGVLTPMNSSRMSYFTDTEYPFSLPALFSEAGYRVNSFHQSNRNMYNRGNIHENWGYEKYNAGQSLGLSDLKMDTALLEAYDSIVPNERFMSFVITISGHGPYTAQGEAVEKYEELIRPQLPDSSEDEYVFALCHAYETDMFIKGLMDRLESDGRLEDTALIFYTDHYDHYVTGEGILEKYKGTADTNLMGNVPCFIYSRDLAPMTVDKVISSYDLTPTIVNLFGLDCDGRYYLGNDAFSDNGGYVIFRDMSWYDGEIYFNITEDSATELSKRMDKEISQRLNACWDGVKFNYYKGK